MDWQIEDVQSNWNKIEEILINTVRYTSTTQSMLGRQLPKVTLVGTAIPPNEAFLG